MSNMGSVSVESKPGRGAARVAAGAWRVIDGFWHFDPSAGATPDGWPIRDARGLLAVESTALSGFRTVRTPRGVYVTGSVATWTPPVLEWPVTGADIDIHPGDPFVDIIAEAPEGSDIFLHRNLDGSPYTYHLHGIAEITHADNITIRTLPPRVTLLDPICQVYAVNPWVTIDGGGGARIFNWDGVTGGHLYGLRLTNVTHDGVDQTTGRGIHRGEDFLVEWCLIDNCGLAALSSGWGVVQFCELRENSGDDTTVNGVRAALKTIYSPSVVQHSWIHHNYVHGLWIDCDQEGWEATCNLIQLNVGTGGFNEISRGPSLWQHNTFDRNNTGGTAGRGGLIVTSSYNVEILDNRFTGNQIQNLRTWDDDRSGNGPNACASGYYIKDILVQGNTFVGHNPRYRFFGGPDVTVSADGVHTNPNDNTGDLVYADNIYA